MSETDSFFQEVSEEVRRDKLYKFLRKYMWVFVGIVLLIVGGAAANEYLKAREKAAAEAAGDALRAAQIEATSAAFAELANSEAPSAVLARMEQAAALVAEGQKDAGVALYMQIASSSNAPEIYSQLALLKAIMLGGEAMADSEFSAAIARLTAPEAPFRMLAFEQQALHLLANGQKDEAAAILRNILTSDSVTRELATRAQQLLTALGGATQGA
ncbi:MAG TPA: hypothetical protein VLA51_00105 [Paracoccaceae bacterium]|nr:hypothetical protein [Paracoccaceae bacterium]